MKSAIDSAMRRDRAVRWVVLLAALTSAWGCGDAEEPTPTVEDQGTSLSSDVFPIIQRYGCGSTGCHDDATRPTTHWTDLRTAESVWLSWVGSPGGMLGFNHCDPSGSTEGFAVPNLDTRRVEPGEPDQSLVIQKLEEKREACDPFYGRMPPYPLDRMAPEDIAVIRKWIAEGAPEN